MKFADDVIRITQMIDDLLGESKFKFQALSNSRTNIFLGLIICTFFFCYTRKKKEFGGNLWELGMAYVFLLLCPPYYYWVMRMSEVNDISKVLLTIPTSLFIAAGMAYAFEIIFDKSELRNIRGYLMFWFGALLCIVIGISYPLEWMFTRTRISRMVTDTVVFNKTDLFTTLGSIVWIVVLLIITPIVLGLLQDMLLVKRIGRLGMCYSKGFFLEIAVFFVISVGPILRSANHYSFSDFSNLVKYIYLIIDTATIIFIVIRKRIYKDKILGFVKPDLWSAMSIVVAVLGTFFTMPLEHDYTYDYVNEALQGNTLYSVAERYITSDGIIHNNYGLRFANIHLFYAMIAQVTKLPVQFVYNIAFSVIVIMVWFAVWREIYEQLFDGESDRFKRVAFLGTALLYYALQVFLTNENTALLIFANPQCGMTIGLSIILPLLFVCSLKIKRNGKISVNRIISLVILSLVAGITIPGGICFSAIIIACARIIGLFKTQSYTENGNKSYFDRILGCLVACTTLLIVAFTVVVIGRQRLTEVDLSDVRIANEGEYGYSIDQFDVNNGKYKCYNNYLSITGWVFQPEVIQRRVRIKIALKNTLTGKFYTYPAKVWERSDLNEVFNDGFDYLFSGFAATIPYKDEFLDEGYQIYLYYMLNDDEVLVCTDRMLE